MDAYSCRRELRFPVIGLVSLTALAAIVDFTSYLLTRNANDFVAQLMLILVCTISAVVVVFFAYFTVIPFRWSLRIGDGFLEWRSPLLPRSTQRVAVKLISDVLVTPQQVLLIMQDGSRVLVPPLCITNQAEFLAKLEANLHPPLPTCQQTPRILT